MKGLIGFCFFLLTFAYSALCATLSYFFFKLGVLWGVLNIILFVVVYILIVTTIKRKFDYYKSEVERSQKISKTEKEEKIEE